MRSTRLELVESREISLIRNLCVAFGRRLGEEERVRDGRGTALSPTPITLNSAAILHMLPFKLLHVPLYFQMCD